MLGLAVDAIFDLMTAAGSRGGDQGGCELVLDGGEEDQAADLHRYVIMFFFIAEGAGHATAACW